MGIWVGFTQFLVIDRNYRRARKHHRGCPEKQRLRGVFPIKIDHPLCSSIGITFAAFPAPLIILTRKNFPSRFAVALLFCQTQMTETLKVLLPAESWRGKISRDFFSHQSVPAACSGSDPPTSLAKASDLRLFLLLSLSGHKAAGMWDSALLPVTPLDVRQVGFSQLITHSHMKD